MSATVNYAARNHQWIPLAGGDPIDPEPAVSELLVPRSGAWWGAYTGGTDAADTAFETLSGRKMDVVSTYYQANKTGPGVEEAKRLKKGRIVLMSVATKSYSGASNVGGYMSWANIAAGTHDSFWTSWGNGLAALPGKVFFTFDQEAATRINQDANLPDKTPAHYVSAFRRIHDVITPLAPNVVWVFWAAGVNQAQEASLYPGDAYVDWILWDPYKWPSHSVGETTKQTWQGFNTYLNGQTWGHGKPRGLAETGVDTNGFAVAVVNSWWAGAPQAAADLGFKMVIFFDRNAWQIDAKPTYQTGYKTAGHDTRFNQPHA